MAFSIFRRKRGTSSPRKGQLPNEVGRGIFNDPGETWTGVDTVADEGEESDVEAEMNEEHNRRAKPAEGPVERSAQGGFLMRQPCWSSLMAPTGHEQAFNAHEKPQSRLKLDFVHGYRGHDTRHNVMYNADGLVVYHAAAAGIVYDFEEHTQRYFLRHTDDILCLAMHPDRDIVATGQVGKDPTICVWSSATCEMLAELRGFHQRAVISLSFDATGRYLASVGLDDEHSVAVYDWQARRMVANSKGDDNRIFLCSYNPFDGRLVTGGVHHVKFWVMEGGYLVGKNGVYGRVGHVSTTLSIAFHPDGTTLTGTQGGVVYQWADGGEECIQKFDFVHNGPINDIMITEDYIITGGKDGKVHYFSLYFEKVFTIEMAKVAQTMTDENGRPICYYDGKTLCVRAMFMDGTNLLVGLRSSEIFEFDMSSEDSWLTGQKIITQGHTTSFDSVGRFCDGELWGLATHPSKPIIMTAGDDKTVRQWDMLDRAMLTMRSVPDKARSCAYNHDGKFAAVGFKNGGFLVFETKDGRMITQKRHRREEISELKYSPDGRWLAAGSHDNFIDIYDTSRAYKRVGTCKGHASYITHIDWSQDGKLLQSNSGDYELLFWEIPSCDQIRFPAAVKDVPWATFTCTLGWPVQGMWPKYADGTDVNACDRAQSKQVMAAVDDFGMLKLFRYPIDVGRADYHGYSGHAAHVSNVRFSFNDEYLISIGGGDRCIFQWRHYQADEDDENLTSDTEEEILASMEDYEAYNKANQLNQMVVTGYSNGTPVFTPLDAAMSKPRKDIPQGSGLDAGSRLGYMECAGAIFAPDGYLREPDALAACMEAVELEHVYGYRAHDCRENIFYSNRGEVVYHSGCVGIVYSSESNTQRFLVDDPTTDAVTGHTDDIISIARHPMGNIFATGEVGMNPKIIVWSSDDPRKPRAVIQGFLKKGVIALTFSRDGNLVVGVGNDPDHSIAIYRWQTGTLVSTARGSQEKIVSINWSPYQDYVVTLGLKHCKFWSVDPLKEKHADYQRRGKLQTCLCCCFPGPDTTVVGTQDGSLYLFKGFQLALTTEHAHEVTQSCAATRDMIVSAGKEGLVKFWAQDLSQCLKEVEVTHPQSLGSCIKSLYLLGSMLLIGTRTGEMYEMDTTSYSYSLIMQGHSYGAVHGMAVHPFEHQFVTTGDDMTVRVWDVPSRRMLLIRDLGGKGRSCAYHPDGSQIAIGLVGGGYAVLSSDSLDTMFTKKDREEPIHELKYSPSGQFLAVGSYDNYIDVYDVGKQYGRVGVAKGHSSYIRHFDWSSDSTVLQSNSGNHELKFWEMPSGKEIKHANDTRNVDWHSWTCVVGWPVQGIWPRLSSGTDVFSVDRSHTRTCVASGDRFGMLNLYMYPCHKGTARRVFTGHSSRVLNLRFVFDDTYVITVGGDMNVMQWRVIL